MIEKMRQKVEWELKRVRQIALQRKGTRMALQAIAVSEVTTSLFDFACNYAITGERSFVRDLILVHKDNLSACLSKLRS